METKAVRLYGKKDLRLETFELPAVKSDEILVKIISDAICMSSYKAAIQGAQHKRVPDDVADNPTIIGHEFSGEIVEVGSKWSDGWKTGDRFVIQPAINYKGSLYAPGYSYKYIGGAMTYGIVPQEFMECGCLLPYNGEAFFYGSLSEPMSCITGTFHANYHTRAGSYRHEMGIKEGGRLIILGGAGPMGLGAADYALHGPVKPSLIIVTDIAEARLKRAAEILPPEEGKRQGVELRYVDTSGTDDAAAYLKSVATDKPAGFDDVFVFAPVAPLVELADKILNYDGCLNFFAGPSDPEFSAKFNFYNVHYNATHIVGTSGGNTDDMKESISLMQSGRINPAAMITHVGGLNAVIDATLNLPEIPGGKKLIYTQIDMPLTAIDDMKGSGDPTMKKLGEITGRNRGLWCAEAEAYLLRAMS